MTSLSYSSTRMNCRLWKLNWLLKLLDNRLQLSHIDLTQIQIDCTCYWNRLQFTHEIGHSVCLREWTSRGLMLLFRNKTRLRLSLWLTRGVMQFVSWRIAMNFKAFWMICPSCPQCVHNGRCLPQNLFWCCGANTCSQFDHQHKMIFVELKSRRPVCQLQYLAE